MTARPRVTETDVAKGIIAYLADLHWECFSEVTGAVGRADIVARQGPIIWVIETKIAFNLTVIEQAKRWIPHAHRVSVGTSRYPSQFGQEVCRLFGVGVLSAGDHNHVREPLYPKLNRKPWKIPTLCEEHKTYAEAGSNGGGYFTPFRRTIKAVEEVIGTAPGITIKALVDQIDHHYSSNSSARQHLSKWITDGHIPGYKIKHEGRHSVVVRIGALA